MSADASLPAARPTPPSGQSCHFPKSTKRASEGETKKNLTHTVEMRSRPCPCSSKRTFSPDSSLRALSPSDGRSDGTQSVENRLRPSQFRLASPPSSSPLVICWRQHAKRRESKETGPRLQWRRRKRRNKTKLCACLHKTLLRQSCSGLCQTHPPTKKGRGRCQGRLKRHHPKAKVRHRCNLWPCQKIMSQ